MHGEFRYTPNNIAVMIIVTTGCFAGQFFQTTKKQISLITGFDKRTAFLSFIYFFFVCLFFVRQRFLFSVES